MSQAVTIPDFAGKTLGTARTFCTQNALKLAVQGTANAAAAADSSIIETNGTSSQPGTTVSTGGTVSVIIFPLEPRQQKKR